MRGAKMRKKKIKQNEEKFSKILPVNRKNVVFYSEGNAPCDREIANDRATKIVASDGMWVNENGDRYFYYY